MFCPQPYVLSISENNVKHLPWWWDGDSVSKFQTINQLVQFLQRHIPVSEKTIAEIYRTDAQIQYGVIFQNTWYKVEKVKEKYVKRKR